MTKYEEPEVVHPGTLGPGDQIGCSDAGPRLQVLVGDTETDAVWRTLLNEPGKTTHWPEWGQWRPVPHGGVALQFGEDHDEWVCAALPRVLARRAIA